MDIKIERASEYIPYTTITGGRSSSIHGPEPGYATKSDSPDIEPISILKVKDWKRRGDYERNAQEYLRASQYMQKEELEIEKNKAIDSQDFEKCAYIRE